MLYYSESLFFGKTGTEVEGFLEIELKNDLSVKNVKIFVCSYDFEYESGVSKLNRTCHKFVGTSDERLCKTFNVDRLFLRDTNSLKNCLFDATIKEFNKLCEIR